MHGARKGLLCAVISLGTCAPVLADMTTTEPSPCESGETIVFSCSTGSKRISLCQAGTTDGNEPRLSYRYGQPGAPPDLVYQAATGASSGFQAGTETLSGGGGAWIEFSRQRHRYVVFSFWIQGEGEVSGVAVERSGRRITTQSCQQAAISRLGADYFSSARLPLASQDFQP